eukprot:COSAG04_NODE_15363_length_534_cov_0.875862_1_plen_148_part_01
MCAQVVQSTAHPVLRIDPAVFIPNDERVKRMGPVEAEDLRVMSYNVLWGLSAESATAKAASWQVTPVARESLGATASGIIADLQQLPVPITSRCYREHVLLPTATAIVGSEMAVCAKARSAESLRWRGVPSSSRTSAMRHGSFASCST